MKRLTDEILNKYIDGELSRAELEEIEELINSNPEELDRLKTHKYVDQTLKELEVDTAPPGVAQRIMKRIYSEIPEKYKKNSFFRFMIGSFVTIIAVVLGYSLSLLPSGSDSESSTLIDSESIKDYSTKFYNEFTSFFSNDNLIYIGIFLTVIMLITAYFVHESHKSFKKKLERIA